MHYSYLIIYKFCPVSNNFQEQRRQNTQNMDRVYLIIDKCKWCQPSYLLRCKRNSFVVCDHDSAVFLTDITQFVLLFLLCILVEYNNVVRF